MKSIMISSAALFAAALPIAASAAPAVTTSVQSICEPAVTTLPDGTVVEGQFCYSVGGRV